MQPFTRLTALAAPLAEDNVDTDIILPARFLLLTEKQGLGVHAFHERRQDADFMLNQPRFADAQILVAGANFGCGSSREHAPWALADLGLRAIVAPSFGEIFASNCVKNGMLPAVVTDHVPLLAQAEAGRPLTIDLVLRTIITADGSMTPFAVDDWAREALLNGWGEVDTILEHHAPAIAGFEAAQRASQPLAMEQRLMANAILRERLDAGTFVAAPGLQDMIAAVVANKVGFDIVYGSGYWLTASALGLPDAGIASYTQMLDRMATLVQTSDAAVIADADTGYGGLLNVHHTVRGYEEAGVTAIQLEDQEFPKKCGHTPFKRLIPTADMADKIKVAVDARRDPNFLVVARTDARQSEGFDGAIARARAYGDAGADILFVEALTSEDEMRRACDALDRPMMANMSNGGLTPMRSARELADIGYAMAIFPAMTSLIAAAAMEQALRRLKDDGEGQPAEMPLFDFKEFCGLIGFQDVWDFEQKWAR